MGGSPFGRVNSKATAEDVLRFSAQQRKWHLVWALLYLCAVKVPFVVVMIVTFEVYFNG